MSFRLRIKYYLIHALNYTNKTANELISSGKITVNGNIINENIQIYEEDEIRLEDKIVRSKKSYRYFILNKPRGIESTFDKNRENNLTSVFPFTDEYFVAGRLDKDSEGMLLISNDGKWVNSITRDDAFKEKEYRVKIDKEPDALFIQHMANGVDIGFYITRKCKIWRTGDFEFHIILTEGKNKQIRRMCKRLGMKVQSLLRVRIDKFYLSDIKLFEFQEIYLT